ncbi:MULTISPECIES: hypothetical protein [Streptomyces]|uniref:SH3 domain-containing protein n=1 Tax=Streptomyces cadmiisoli TaxID=2184053 RepID=A0A2Z4JDY3_9ACTN|nr:MULTISPECIES: hypothetical protein [Streptomyces]AWW43315.1 hypothetical protein DN051_42855 [Streptomyces cadmiisoli]
MRKAFRKLGMVTTVIASAVALATPASAAPAESSRAAGDASAMACEFTWSPNPAWYDQVDTGTVNKASAPLRPGPFADCGTRETLYRNYTMTVYCYYINGHGNAWFYVSAYPNWTRGWIYEGNISTAGDVYPC